MLPRAVSPEWRPTHACDRPCSVVVDVFLVADQNAAAGSQLRFLNGQMATNSRAGSDVQKKQPGLAAGLLVEMMEKWKALSNDSDPP